ncbi:MAG TPA: acetyl-coenzyme A synthetase N-terminal domain-containing protein, partial [bacterium]|nr:acetyl-coenzyme A synthetase N-terminal domain-containing protein [bacterium]
MATTYAQFFRRSIDQKEAFWGELAQMIHWHKPPRQVLDYSRPPFAKWYVGGETNLCYNCVDRHLATRGEQPAVVWIS